jgi:polysaccharide biosynthesis transport protein
LQNDKRHELVFLRRHWITMVAFILLGAGAGWTVSQFSSPVYKSQSSVYFFPDSSLSATDLNQGSTYTKNQMVSFAKLATAPIVLDSVVRDLSLGTTARALGDSIDVSFAPDSLILQIVAGDQSPTRARDIANAIARKLSVVVEEIGPNAVAGKGRISAEIIEQATAASNPVSPDERANIAAGAFLGLLLGFLIGLLREKVRSRVQATSDLRAAGPGAVLGVVEPCPAGIPLLEADPSGKSADQYRRAAMHLQQFHGTTGPLSLVVAAVSSQSSNSQVADNLAAAFAEQDAQVIVVRTNPARGATESRGLSEVLDGDLVLEEAIIPAAGGTYDRLMSGKPGVNRHRQLASKGFDSLIARLQSLYDVVLVEAVPLGEAAQGLQIARRLDGLVLTVEEGTTRRRDVQARLEEVRSTGVPLSGVVYCLRTRRSKYRAPRVPAPVSGPASSAPRHEMV